MRFGTLMSMGALCAATILPTHVQALTVTREECEEGADFIRNAAHSRENGLSSERFLERLDDDLLLIRTVPLALRWFVRDAEDEALLRDAASAVFSLPRPPSEHHQDFLATCRTRVLAQSESARPVAVLP